MGEDRQDEINLPQQIEDLIAEVEMENMKTRNGWATGSVVLIDGEGNRSREIEQAWIELFNGEGEAANTGGVRFMAVVGGEYEEAYAYPDEETAEEYGSPPYWYVTEYNEENVEYGVNAPQHHFEY